ncbi:NAD(P)-dependent malic enzyme [Streptomonospora salina]|uniref:Malate dehydrogenase (Oxaloacetate-decarboxylating) n=1 Tax=Streptomonospora salina TaxID=104205 RepID=A0A841E1M9_9ACTN|nr:NADP-dependent malic enzyme [Streptomonospora salina]MBB5997707.1 malate dehydrogenase (oxaloacetate-decarboxylating) [Streptomonospora salina]
MPTTDSHSRLDDDPAFDLHRGGKLHVEATVEVNDHDDLALAYTPGVARVCTAIADAPELVDTYTWKSSVVAVVTDGSAVLGLGDIGPQASLPVMEGKALLFRKFAGVDAVPVALSCDGVDDIVETVERMAPSFGGVNLEDISAPRCFDIERRLRERLDIPVFHDDQHGTAIVTVAALRNAARLTGRSLADLRVVVSGAGAAGVAVTRMLVEGGIGDIAVADSKGMIYAGRDGLTPIKAEIAGISNRAGITGSIEGALEGADVFIGLSAGELPESVVASMAPEAIVFAMANPTPEIHPDAARRHAAVVATGRSDFPNQINNVLAFPGVFRGALDARARDITEPMKLAAAGAIADLVGEDLGADYVIPSTFDSRVVPAVSEAVSAQARRDGVARV